MYELVKRTLWLVIHICGCPVCFETTSPQIPLTDTLTLFNYGHYKKKIRTAFLSYIFLISPLKNDSNQEKPQLSRMIKHKERNPRRCHLPTYQIMGDNNAHRSGQAPDGHNALEQQVAIQPSCLFIVSPPSALWEKIGRDNVGESCA